MESSNNAKSPAKRPPPHPNRIKSISNPKRRVSKSDYAAVQTSDAPTVGHDEENDIDDLPPPPMDPETEGGAVKASAASSAEKTSEVEQKNKRPVSLRAKSSEIVTASKTEVLDLEKGDGAQLKEISLVDTSKSKSPVKSTNAKDAKDAKVDGKPQGKESDGKTPRDSKLSTLDVAKEEHKKRFKGRNNLQYALWAHYLAYGAAAIGFFVGIFAIAWDHATTYDCKVEGQLINAKYLMDPVTKTCASTYTPPGGSLKYVCCEPGVDPHIHGNTPIGVIYMLYSIATLFMEDTNLGYGLYYPNDSFSYLHKVSIIGTVHIVIGIIGLAAYSTCLGGACFIYTGFVFWHAARREECGDGGRFQRQMAAAKAKSSAEEKTLAQQLDEGLTKLLSYNPVAFYRRIYNEDKLSSYVWVGIYVVANIILFCFTLALWEGTVGFVDDGLLNGTLDINCSERLCHALRKAIRYGPFSGAAPWAKACGNCLNMNCSLILLPVIRMLLRKLNNVGESFNKAQQSDIFTKFLAHPLTRYIPLAKNIEFHKLVAAVIFLFAWGHMLFHFINLTTANEATLAIFRFARWDGTDYFTGALVTFAIFVMYTAAPDVVRHSKFEIFFRAHHWFILFFLAMFLHGPVFIYWAIIPVLLYLFERYMQLNRGNKPYLLVKVEWISPVMAVHFRPAFKEDFVFREGQYLYLNCPAISPDEWHPFTISSASDDINFGPRIHLESGEEVMEIPRPSNLPPNAKWSKYCLASQDWRALNPHEYLEKSETGYHDYVSLHIKVHGLDDPVAKSWTRRFKEYIELMNPGDKFPFYFSRRDARGDILVGRQFGPDGKTPIIRVDGPHSAPSEHYSNYGTVMVIGAGIGLTPCVSILTALTKYRWKKNFNPEILHFYWVVRHNEVESFQWLVHMLTDLSFELKRGRDTNQIERRYYCEINIYVTGFDSKIAKDVKPLPKFKKNFAPYGNSTPLFTADELYGKMMNPTVESKGQVKKMKAKNASNRLQDIWVWNGRPQWDEVFQEVKEQRQHSDIGVCFCGAAAIGADLRDMCEKYSSVDDDCLFSLHKENF